MQFVMEPPSLGDACELPCTLNLGIFWSLRFHRCSSHLRLMGNSECLSRECFSNTPHPNELHTLESSKHADPIGISLAFEEDLVSSSIVAWDLNNEVQLADGSIYKGQWKNKQMCGYGKLTKQNGQVYEGSFLHGRAHGYGLLVCKDCDRFASQQLKTPHIVDLDGDDVLSKLESPPCAHQNQHGGGFSYNGQWQEGYRHGYGKQSSRMTLYEGEWYFDEKCGEGYEEQEDGSSYEGEFWKNCKHGLGSLVSSKGWCLKGQFEMDSLDGHGRCTFKNGCIYMGQWKSGHMSGIGEMILPNGSRYVGGYERGAKCGEGTFTWPDGHAYEGQWKNGKRDGHGVVIGVDGVATDGEWKLGKRVAVKSSAVKKDAVSAGLGLKDCDMLGIALTRGSHVKIHSRSGVLSYGPDSDGRCKVTFDEDLSESAYISWDLITKVPFEIGNHVLVHGDSDWDCGVITSGPDAEGSFHVESKTGRKKFIIVKEKQLYWSSLQPQYCLPPSRHTHGDATKVLYHKTARGDEIRQTGKMLRGRVGVAGGGIYFAENLHSCQRKARSKGWIVKAHVLVGKPKVVAVSSDTPQFNFWELYDAGFDSVELQGFPSGKEYVVYNKDQVQIIDVYEDDAS